MFLEVLIPKVKDELWVQFTEVKATHPQCAQAFLCNHIRGPTTWSVACTLTPDPVCSSLSDP